MAILARSRRSSRSERMVGPWGGAVLKMSLAVRWSLAPRAISAEMTMRRSSGSCSATLRAPLASPRASRRRASSSSAWAKSTEWSHLSAVRAAGSELRAPSRLPAAAQIRARSNWAKYSKPGRAPLTSSRICSTRLAAASRWRRSRANWAAVRSAGKAK